jgi:hypothetical protein
LATHGKASTASAAADVPVFRGLQTEIQDTGGLLIDLDRHLPERT